MKSLVSLLLSDIPSTIYLEKSGSWDFKFISKSSEELTKFGLNFPVPQIPDVKTLLFFIWRMDETILLGLASSVINVKQELKTKIWCMQQIWQIYGM